MNWSNSDEELFLQLSSRHSIEIMQTWIPHRVTMCEDEAIINVIIGIEHAHLLEIRKDIIIPCKIHLLKLPNCQYIQS